MVNIVLRALNSLNKNVVILSWYRVIYTCFVGSLSAESGSLKHDVLLLFAEAPHERRGPVRFHNSLSVDIVVVPSLIESVLQEVVDFFALLSEVGLDDLTGELFGLVSGDEELSAWKSFLGHSLSSVVLDHIGSEGVDWMSVIAVQMARQGSVVGVFPHATVLVVSNETMEACWETTESWVKLLDSASMSETVDGTWLVLSDLHVLGLLVFGVRGTLGAAVIMSLSHLWRNLLLLLFVDDYELVNWERAVNIFELCKH